MKWGRLSATLPAMAALALLVAACSNGPATAPDETPVITISGVDDGGSYTAPVTIAIALDRGTYTATLDGEPFHSGTTVSAIGQHTLAVTARNGVSTATKQITFTIQGPPGGALIVRLIDLGAQASGGGGDAILVTDSSAGGMVHAVIDAGPASGSTSDTYVSSRLQAMNIDTLAFMLLTHAHADHYSGMSSILAALEVQRFYYNGQVRSAVSYERTISDARAAADTVIVVRDTIPFAFGRSAVQSRFTMLPPLATWLNIDTDSSTFLNDGSVGVQLRRGSAEMFFTGDSEVAANNRWRTQFAAYTRDIDVLKVGHHGANNAIFDNGFSGASTWLTHTDPSISVISANGRSHPRRNALTRLLAQSNMRTYCTNVHGDITLRIYSDGSVHVTVQKAADMDCVAGSEANS